jgi:hypothetical protein
MTTNTSESRIREPRRKTMSLKQIAANRRNARKSTGPRTPAGRAVDGGLHPSAMVRERLSMRQQKAKARPQLKEAAENPFLLRGHRRCWFKGGSAQIVCDVGDAVIVRDNPGKSISHMEVAWRSAEVCKEHGLPIAEHTRGWLKVPYWTDEREKQEIQSFLLPSDDTMRPGKLSVRVLLNCSPAAAQALGSMASECLNQLQVVADSVRESELNSDQASIAAEELAWVIGNACCKLNELARTHPRIFHPFSRKDYSQWPVMKSTYPEFGDDEAGLLRGLQLGWDLPLRLDRKAQWARWLKDDTGADRLGPALVRMARAFREQHLGRAVRRFGQNGGRAGAAR